MLFKADLFPLTTSNCFAFLSESNDIDENLSLGFMESSQTSSPLIKSLLIRNAGNPFFRDYLFSYTIVLEYVKETVSERIFVIFRSAISDRFLILLF